MKAWEVTSSYNDGESYIVFAETAGKARSFVLGREGFEGLSFPYIKANRLESADKYYKEGKTHLSWQDPKDRIILARDYDWVCLEPDLGECEACKAKKHCLFYQNYQDEL